MPTHDNQTNLIKSLQALANYAKDLSKMEVVAKDQKAYDEEFKRVNLAMSIINPAFNLTADQLAKIEAIIKLG